jgi:acetyl-CoA/propionyl-CoA carboxylase biotin carboxyl carrier protein
VFALTRWESLQPTGAVIDPWDMPTGWRPGGRRAPLRWDVAGPDGDRLPAALTAGTLLRIGDGEDHEVRGEPVPGGLLLTVDGRTTTARTVRDGATTWVHVDGKTVALTELPPARLHAGAASADTTVRSPMPGSVIAVHVADGATVEEGAPLLAVEAMKMEHTLTAPAAGTVELAVQVGDQVAVDQELAVVHPVEAS